MEKSSVDHHRVFSPVLLLSLEEGSDRSVVTVPIESLADSYSTGTESFGSRMMSIPVESVGFDRELINIFRDEPDEERQPLILWLHPVNYCAVHWVEPPPAAARFATVAPNVGLAMMMMMIMMMPMMCKKSM